MSLSTELPKCLYCGKTTRMWQNRPQRFCSHPNGKSTSRCARRYRYENDPDKEAKAKKKNKRDYQKIINDPVRYEKLQAKRRRRYLKHRDRILAENRAYSRKQRQRGNKPKELVGSVILAASKQSDGYDLLSLLYSSVPKNIPDQTRMEIISEAAVLVLEGKELSEAVKQATTTSYKFCNALSYAKPIDDCHWL